MAFDFNILGGLFKTVGDVIDSMHTSDEERLLAKAALMDAQQKTYAEVLAYEKTLVQAKQAIIVAEAQGQSWLQRNWRPLIMLMFGSILLNNYILLPYLPGMEHLDMPDGMWTLLTVGIGGYVAGRSGEKIVSNLRTKDNS